MIYVIICVLWTAWSISWLFRNIDRKHYDPEVVTFWDYLVRGYEYIVFIPLFAIAFLSSILGVTFELIRYIVRLIKR